MPLKITDIAALSQYAEGVMARSEHHADNVGGIALTLLGAILWRADNAELQVFGSGGQPGNVLWVEISGHRYCFSYDHQAEEIVMKDRNTQGAILHRFSNSTAPADVEAIFRSL